MDDEKAIRELYATWHRATAAGDLATVLGLMSDDVVFLTPGAQPFGKKAFADLNESLAKKIRIESRFEFGEIAIHGDWAHVWSRLWVTMPTLNTGKGRPMSKKSDAMKRKAKQMAKKNLAKAKVKVKQIKARAKVELSRHMRAFKAAAKRYKLSLKQS